MERWFKFKREDRRKPFCELLSTISWEELPDETLKKVDPSDEVHLFYTSECLKTCEELGWKFSNDNPCRELQKLAKLRQLYQNKKPNENYAAANPKNVDSLQRILELASKEKDDEKLQSVIQILSGKKRKADFEERPAKKQKDSEESAPLRRSSRMRRPAQR